MPSLETCRQQQDGRRSFVGACTEPRETVRRRDSRQAMFGDDDDDITGLANCGDAGGRITAQHLEFTRHADVPDDLIHQSAGLDCRLMDARFHGFRSEWAPRVRGQPDLARERQLCQSKQCLILDEQTVQIETKQMSELGGRARNTRPPRCATCTFPGQTCSWICRVRFLKFC